MTLVDLIQPWNIHNPGWVGYPGSNVYYSQTFQTNKVVAQRIETSPHVSTHMDAPMHLSRNPKDIASLPLERLVRDGVIVDVSDAVSDWDEIKPEHIAERIEVRQGDILICYTGFARYCVGRPEQDLGRYFRMHPGWRRPGVRRVVGQDGNRVDNRVDSGGLPFWRSPMNITIRDMRPDMRVRTRKR